MALRKLEDMTDEEVKVLTEEQQDILADKGEIDIPDTPPADQPPPADDKPDSLPPDDKGADEGQDALPPEDDVPTLKRKLADLERREQELRRESEGRLRDLIDLRRKKPDEKKPDEPKKSPFADILQDVQDDDFIDAKRLKSVVQKVEEYVSAKEQDFNAAVNEKVQQMETERRVAVIEDSRKRAEKAHPDYIQKVDEFYKSVTPLQAQLINQELLKSQDPAEELYQTATRLSALNGGTPAKLPANRPAPRILGSGGGGGNTPKLTAEKLLSMSDAEIAKLERENPDLLRALHKEMGET